MGVDQTAETNYTFREAGEVFGVSAHTLKRRQKAGELPEAELTEGPHGEEWRLPAAALVAIAAREDWSLNLDLTPSDGEPSAVAWVSALRTELDAEYQGVADALRAEVSAANDRVRRSEDDSEAARARADRLQADLIESQRIALEREGATKAVEAKLEPIEQERDRLLNELRNRAVELEQERTERRELGERLEYERLGWWAKRRHSRSDRT